jgi:broad specificity phosphatase PhoE
MPATRHNVNREVDIRRAQNVYGRGHMRERRFTFVRHASTVYNDKRLLNGDPYLAVPLDAEGHVAAAALAPLVARCPPDLALHTRFARTRETLMLLLGRRHDVRVEVEPGFDDIDVGVFEGRNVQAYRDWRARHGHDEAVPDGESRLAALARYAGGCARLLARHDARGILLVVHDVPIRFLRNAMAATDPLDGPVRTVANLECLSVGPAELAAALAVMRRRLSGLPPA